MKRKINYTKPSITEREVSYAEDAARNGWGENCYDYINKFEKMFSVCIGVKYAIATSSCTGALHMGLSALGIGPGDEVILSDINWIATAAPIVHLGATPVIVDTLPDTWCINPKKVEESITSKTKAIIATHIYGNVCDMDSLIKVGKRYNIPIIEDAAEAIGSKWRGIHAGAIGDFGVFSFHGTKTITTGEGGIFVTNNRSLYEKVLTLSNHGRSRQQERQFWPEIIGFKYKMSNIQAAIGCAQLERIGDLIERKREIFNMYKERLKNLNCITLNPEPDGVVNGFWMPTVVFDKRLNVNRDFIIKEFQKENIDARIFFWPLSELPPLKDIGKYNFTPVAHDISSRAINLPSYHDITEEEIGRVVAVIYKFLNGYNGR